MKNKCYFYTDKMTVGYDGKPLIKEIKIELLRGQILTLIGPNGAGKSTILKSITKQLKILGGCVYLDQKQMKELSGKETARKMAVVLTDRMKPELMTCEDVVAAGRYPYTGSLGILNEEDRAKTREALELVQALELADRDFSAISDGQKQRILLARAICQEPEMIVLDEPTSFLDIRHKLEFLSILKKLVRERQVAVVMSLHELDLAQKISDLIICIKGEYVDKSGTPEEIFTDDYISSLYEIKKGSYHSNFGCVELPAPSGKPEVFVIAGGGSGISCYRRLQREGIPFITGVLHENDIDYEAARTLACEVIAESAFEPVSEAHYIAALEKMKQCREVKCCLDHFGTGNAANQRLLAEAEKQGKLI
ncbi:MAG: ABC transporter ATP-binding protein [Lachnospiraceae bacterium]|nr:ABC transporter ATP-binding protein [Lachnospiraceae bacterium]